MSPHFFYKKAGIILTCATEDILKKSISILIFLFALQALVYGQKGKFFLSHHQPTSAKGNVYFDLAQSENGLIYVATKSGVFEFDGREWNPIKTPGSVYTIVIEGEEIFLGGRKGFGVLKSNLHNQSIYHSLSDQLPEANDITYSLLTADEAYFLSRDHLFVISRKNHEVIQSISATKENGAFLNIAEINNEVYIQTELSGLMKYTQSQLTPHNLQLPADIEIVFYDKLKGTQQYAIYSATDSLYLLTNNTVRHVAFADSDYLSANVVIGGAWVNHNLLALGTIRGGVVLIDPLTGETVEMLNYLSGLPDNEVMTINADHQSSVWVAHQYGFTRIMPDLPFRAYSHYPGLQGKLLASQTYFDKVYVGTSVGLFSLKKNERYDEIIYYVQSKPRAATSQQAKSSDEESQEPSAEEIKSMRKRGFLNFLKKSKEEETSKKQEAPQHMTAKAKAASPVVQKRVRRELKSIEYIFEPVAGIDTKITQLIPAGNDLFAAGLGGLYLIAKNGEVRQMADQPVRYAYYYEKEGVIFAATYESDILSFEQRNGKWSSSNIFDDFKEYVVHIFADSKGRVWFSGLDRVYWIFLSNLSVLDMDEVIFDNPYFEYTYGIESNNTIYFLNTDGLHRYDEEEKKLLPYERALEPTQIQADNMEIWMLEKTGWYNLRSNSEKPESKNFLNIFQGISSINRDSNSNEIWIVTSDNELYKYNTLESFNQSKYFPLQLKKVSLQDKLVSIGDKYKIEQHEGGLTVSFVQPDFSGLTAVEYRYMLKGAGIDWSEWSRLNNLVNLTFLPVGDYELIMESRNAFGVVSASDPIYFTIDPPYWRQTWFYAIEVGVFLLLVLLSIRLNRFGQRYRILSRVLTFLTIVIFIEFIQTLAGDQFATETSPVIDFLIQVTIAFMILPFESYLRKRMIRQDVDTFNISLKAADKLKKKLRINN